MKALFLVFHGFASHNGISKKIFSQVDALRECGVDTRLCHLEIDSEGFQKRMVDDAVLENYGNGIAAKFKKRMCYGSLAQYISDEKFDFVYMRSDHNANPFLTRFLKRLKKGGIPVVMEISTYPYDNEYSRSPWKRKLYLKQDQLFRRGMARELYRMVTFADYDTIFGVPTIKISNGIDFKQIPLKSDHTDSKVIRLTGVADIHFWHGFDRIISGLADYYAAPQDTKVVFDVVGSGVPAEIAHLKEMVKENKLTDKVFFQGPLWGDDLNEQFNRSDIGIASLARHRCGIDKIKTLKNREYAARGIPFIYSETDDDFDGKPFVVKAPADESPIDIQSLLASFRRIGMSPAEIRHSVEDLSWKKQMRLVVNQITDKF